MVAHQIHSLEVACSIQAPATMETKEMLRMPTDWDVTFGCFMGFVLVDVSVDDPAPRIGFGSTTTVNEAWIPFGIDLGMVTEIKHRHPEMEGTALYVQGEFLCNVNAPIQGLFPKWSAARLAARGKTFQPQ